MKKIMFDDDYGLTAAVREGRKTVTRRIPSKRLWRQYDISLRGTFGPACVSMQNEHMRKWMLDHSPYKVGEVVAVSQSYVDIYHDISDFGRKLDFKQQIADMYGMPWTEVPATFNKMFVLAELMPLRIRITGARFELMQSISDEECLREGIYMHNAAADALGEDGYKFISYAYDATPGENRKRWWFSTPRNAFAALIDKLNGKGTWDKNLWNFAFDFELIKT